MDWLKVIFWIIVLVAIFKILPAFITFGVIGFVFLGIVILPIGLLAFLYNLIKG